MKRISFVLVVCALMAVPTLGNPTGDGKAHLGWWAVGAPTATHQYWDFTAFNYVKQAGTGWVASPEEVINPDPSKVGATITADAWDGSDQFFSSDDIIVTLQIPNYEEPGQYKEIWVDVGASAVPANIVLSAADGGFVDFDYYLLAGQGDADFGAKIVPSPMVETIQFTIPFVCGASLDYIHVDTNTIHARSWCYFARQHWCRPGRVVAFAQDTVGSNE